MKEPHPNEIVFLLYQQADAWDRVADVANLDREVVERFKHYFTLFQDLSDSELSQQLRDIWIRIQRDLMLAEIRGTAQNI